MVGSGEAVWVPVYPNPTASRCRLYLPAHRSSLPAGAVLAYRWFLRYLADARRLGETFMAGQGLPSDVLPYNLSGGIFFAALGCASSLSGLAAGGFSLRLREGESIGPGWLFLLPWPQPKFLLPWTC